MKSVILIALLITVCISLVYAEDVYVRGYYRKDGTYVQPYVRSSPNSEKWDNYGPSQDSYQLSNPRSRDYDSDGMPNYMDRDDDNDGYSDNYDTSQYGE